MVLLLLTVTGPAASEPLAPAITDVKPDRTCRAFSESAALPQQLSKALGPLAQTASVTDANGTASATTETDFEAEAQSLTFSGHGTAHIDVLLGASYPNPLREAYANDVVDFTTTTLTCYTLKGSVSNPPNSQSGLATARCSLYSTGTVSQNALGTGFGNGTPVNSADLGGVIPPGAYRFETFLQAAVGLPAPFTHTISFSDVEFRVARFAPPSYAGRCDNAPGTDRPDLEGTGSVAIDDAGAVTGTIDLGSDVLPFSGVLMPKGTLRPALAYSFTLVRTGKPNLALTLALADAGASVTGTLVEAGTNDTSNVVLTTGVRPALASGTVVDSASAGKDTVKLAWAFPKSGKAFDPRPAAAAFEFGDPAAPLHVDIPANDPAWKGKKGKWTWSTPKGTSPAYKLTLNGVNGVYALAASKLDLAAAPATAFLASVSADGKSAAQTATFVAGHKGKFTYKP